MEPLQATEPAIVPAIGLSERLGARRWTKHLGYVAALAILLVLAVIFLMPLYWMFTGSFKEQIVTAEVPPEMFPLQPTPANWQRLLSDQFPVWRWLANSIIVAGLTAIITLVISSLTGYSFGKKQFPGSRSLFFIMLSTMMLPSQVMLIPLFLLVRSLSLINTYWGMVLPLAASPFGVFLMKQFMATIPNELIDAARIDGASELDIYGRIILPLSRPALAALAIFTFNNAWNNFMWQLLIGQNQDMYTLPVGISKIALQPIGEKLTLDIGLMMAGSSFGALAMIIFFLIFQEHFVKGITFGAVKG
jgi:multiple sugar transport system permease protein